MVQNVAETFTIKYCHLNYFCHFILIYHPVSINVVHSTNKDWHQEKKCIPGLKISKPHFTEGLNKFFTLLVTKEYSFLLFYLDNFCSFLIFGTLLSALPSQRVLWLKYFPYLKAHNNFSLGVPADVTSMAIRNSLKSIVPDLSASKVLKTFWQNFSASPEGKNILYISMNVPGVNFPLGQSCKNPAYHSLIS